MSEKNNFDEKINKALEKVRPQLKVDGGDVEYVGFNKKTGVFQVRLMGMCVGCPMAQVTLNEGILKTVQGEVKEVTGVEQV
ncbi:MAG: NifU family protein [Patescibacteria group bacterium]|nr:NifU family protein [Patescibacteria group bacterium]